MHARPEIKRSAWLLLLAFVVGTVLVPVVHHAFHPHGVAQATAAGETDAVVGNAAPDRVAVGCVICHTPAAAPVAPDPGLVFLLPDDELISADRRHESYPGGISLSARAPPAA